MQIGAQLYTVRASTQTESDFAETIKKVAGIGYPGVQISAVGPIPAQTIRDICDANGVKIAVTHTNPEKIKNDTDAVIADHKIMGANYIGIGMMPAEYRSDGAAGIRRFAEDFKPAAEKIAATGLRMMYHNHDFEYEKPEGKTIMDHLATYFGDTLGFIVDTFWVQAGGGDPAAWLRKLAGRVDVIHFKDMVMAQGQRRMCEILEGNLNWPGIFEACADAGVQWAMVEQDDCYGADPFQCLRVSWDNLARFEEARRKG